MYMYGSQQKGIKYYLQPIFVSLKSNVAMAHSTAAELRGIVIKMNIPNLILCMPLNNNQ